MNRIKLQLVGIDDLNYQHWKGILTTATIELMEELDLSIDLEEVNEVDQILASKVKNIPAVMLNSKVILSQNGHRPRKEQIKIKIQNHLNPLEDMKNILVPIDFSKNAQNAYQFARQFAKAINGRIHLYHVVSPQVDQPEVLGPGALEKTIESREKSLANFSIGGPLEMETLVEEAMVEKELTVGFAAERIIEKTKEAGIDFVIMGTTGAGGMLDKIFGSISSEVAQKADCPVLLIPPDATFRGFKNILYGSNYASADEDVLERISDFSHFFNAKLHLAHINFQDDASSFKWENWALTELFKKKMPDTNIQLSTIENKSIWRGLHLLGQKHDVDLIVITTKYRKWWERLLHRSITKEMALNTMIPTLILHKKK